MTGIRPARARDAAALAALTTQLGYPVDAAALRERLAHLRSRPEDEVLVATGDADDEPVGWIHVARLSSLQDGRVAVVGGLVVDEGHRGTGIGADLLRAAEAWAGSHGAEELVVRTRMTRVDAHRFYEREGYRLVKESRVYAKRLGGRPE